MLRWTGLASTTRWCEALGLMPVGVDGADAAGDALALAARQRRPYDLALADSRLLATGHPSLAARLRGRAVITLARIGDARGASIEGGTILDKPFGPNELARAISGLLEPTGESEDAPVDVFPLQIQPGRTSLNVLVAEDNDFNAELVQELLRRRGHGVTIARDGHAAVAALATGTFDILLLDLHMPGMDGFEVVRTVRATEARTGGHLPVIALTARSRREDRERCLVAGMDDFLSKPLQIQALFAVLERFTTR